MKITLERRGTELVYECKPRQAEARGGTAYVEVQNWQCRIGTQNQCRSNTVRGRNMREDGPNGRAAIAVCVTCGAEAGTLRIEGLPDGALPL